MKVALFQLVIRIDSLHFHALLCHANHVEAGTGSMEAVADGGAGVEADAVDLRDVGTVRMAGKDGIHAILFEQREVSRPRLLAEVKIVFRLAERLANHRAVQEHERVPCPLRLAQFFGQPRKLLCLGLPCLILDAIRVNADERAAFVPEREAVVATQLDVSLTLLRRIASDIVVPGNEPDRRLDCRQVASKDGLLHRIVRLVDQIARDEDQVRRVAVGQHHRPSHQRVGMDEFLGSVVEPDLRVCHMHEGKRAVRAAAQQHEGCHCQ